jgi:hypothetical protein
VVGEQRIGAVGRQTFEHGALRAEDPAAPFCARRQLDIEARRARPGG